ncbi:Sad1-unc-like c-terminal [Mycena sanguinolenta]|uniref:Sad1-unc-like c-terminal n=1 Tax=Mycena sanguinolenta TaxID=230812 RepID=A0A8H6Z8F0_9AGAR|nr:Sad1-unc-like c-terminal [Mycena sanguinolenta]
MGQLAQNAWDADTGFDEVLPPPATPEPLESIDTASMAMIEQTSSTTSEAASTDASTTLEGAARDSTPLGRFSAVQRRPRCERHTQHDLVHDRVDGVQRDFRSALSMTLLVPAPAAGESIYRTIMNRLTALEANHTLYTRYVEEHTSAVREMLRRVDEDLGRAEGMGNAQAQTYARTLLEWEKQRKRVDTDFHELIRRIEHVSDEIILEKRLGISQQLLLPVLVFMTPTRGSLRNLSGSGDWVARLRSQTRNLTQLSQDHKNRRIGSFKVKFLTNAEEKPPVPPTTASKPKPPRLNLYGPARPRSRTRSIGNTVVVEGQRAHSRTPTLGRTPHRRPETPTRAHAHTPAVLPIMHSVSHGSHAPRSARRWARHGAPARVTRRCVWVRDGVCAAAQRHNNGDARFGGSCAALSARPSGSGARSAGLRGMGLDEDSGGGLLFQDPSASPTFDLARGALDGDADAWVDTDGSEVDGDADVGLESPWMERADHVALGA